MNWKRWAMAVVATGVLLLSFQFRTLNYTALLLGYDTPDIQPWMLILNKVVRYLVNDLAALGLIWVIFQRRDFLQFAFGVLLIGLVILLPIYFIGYFYFSQSLGITLSFLHRLVMNPTLMMLLIPLFYYYKKTED
jgi:exosortase F-associated protein